MDLQAEEGEGLTTASLPVLVATAVPVERDAVARALPGAGTDASAGEVRLPGGSLCRTAAGLDLLAAGVGPALAAARVAGALTAAALAGRPYGLVVSAGIGGGFQPDAPSAPSSSPTRSPSPTWAPRPPTASSRSPNWGSGPSPITRRNQPYESFPRPPAPVPARS